MICDMLYSFVPIFKKGVVILDYIIRNKNSLYIKLNKNGAPVTCSESQKGLFECSKANNICNSLQENVRKTHSFRCGMDSIKSKICVCKKRIYK